jgi:hypothetical protein
MKELDFDELDRAVNTLMSDVPKTPAPPSKDDDDDHTTTLDIPSTLDDGQAIPVYTPSAEPIVASVSTPVVNTPTPAARRGGRFMDVVHPSSDMKTASNTPVRPVSRQGVTMSPILPTNTRSPFAQTPKETPVVAEAEQAPSDDVTPPVATTTETSAWPDPLDMAGYQREPDSTVSAVEDDAPVDAPASAPEPVEASSVAHQPVEESPLVTPFLSDTKVEKRPLGMNSSDEPDHVPVAGNAALAEDTPDAENQLPATPEAVMTVLPAELQTDVLSIESDDTSAKEDTLTPAIEAVTAAEVKATGPTSIQQQYKEQPSTGDQATGGIYDTESLHQPLGHPAKKKSGWMWVIWVIVLLILGAGGGAAAYLYLLK